MNRAPRPLRALPGTPATRSSLGLFRRRRPLSRGRALSMLGTLAGLLLLAGLVLLGWASLHH